MSRPPMLHFVEVVTPEHGEKFAEDRYQTDSMEEACAQSANCCPGLGSRLTVNASSTEVGRLGQSRS
jgi:hypothetical protein